MWGHYAEETPHGAAICRTENVSACEPGIAALVDGELAALASAALGIPVVAFKDKLNYKQPGGAGFSPHQDRLAYPGVDRVMSILLAIDDCSLTAGCLWLATGVDEVLPVDDRGVVRADVAATLEWTPAELAPGDAVCIDGLAPHYSEANSLRRRPARPRGQLRTRLGGLQPRYLLRRAPRPDAGRDRTRRPFPHQHARRLRRRRSRRRGHRHRSLHAPVN